MCCSLLELNIAQTKIIEFVYEVFIAFPLIIFLAQRWNVSNQLLDSYRIRVTFSSASNSI